MQSTLALLPALLVTLSFANTELPDSRSCISQGPLLLPPHSSKKPGIAYLDFCQQFRQCTCCDPSTDRKIRHNATPWLLDKTIGTECKVALKKLACRFCDPEVGTGGGTSLCPSLCQEFYGACKNSYFEFRGSGELAICAQHSQQSLVCSKLSELASNGEQLCRQLDLTASPSASCYSGVRPKQLKSCSQAASRKRSKTEWKQKKSASQRRFTQNAWLLATMKLVGLAGLILLLLRWLLRPAERAHRGPAHFQGRPYRLNR